MLKQVIKYHRNKNSMKQLLSVFTMAVLLGSSNFLMGQNLPPVANPDFLSVFTNSGANTLDVQANDTDDGPVIVTTISTPATNGTVLVLNGDSIVYTPDSNFCGTDFFIYNLCDNGAPSLCDTAIVFVTVNPVDSDGDGLNDVFETYTGDFDGDGVYNFLDIDSDNDGISDQVEAQQTLGCSPNPVDTDGDGLPDYLDLDSDNDGVSDVIESGHGSFDTDNDGIIDNLSAVDPNGNGMPDLIEAASPRDFDGDGVNDYIDLDSDNDGVGDGVEVGVSGADSNGDGTVTSADAGFADTDGDGIVDGADGFVGPGDGAGNQDESTMDADRDGLLNFNDLDSDNDGLTDVVEGNHGAADTNDDGVVDGSDSDNDGLINEPTLDANSTFGGNPGTQLQSDQDNDGDGLMDLADLDSDDDGIADVIENGFGVLDLLNIGVLTGMDTDGDGIINLSGLDSNNVYGADAGTQNELTQDFDQDGSINSEDLDADHDGISDLVEGGFGVWDTDDNGVLDSTDTDGDGLKNVGTVDGTSAYGSLPGQQFEGLHDWDYDGILDIFDYDSDSDTIPDVYEIQLGGYDSNNDGMIDLPDTDGDGLADFAGYDNNGIYGGVPGSQSEVAFDADGDGNINSEDVDSDNDGMPDIVEWDWNLDGIGNDNCDKDQLPNFLDPIPCDLFIPDAFSPNSDNINDQFVIDGLHLYPENKFSVFNRWGDLVFEAQPYNNDWNGKSTIWGAVGGGYLPIGTYYYMLDLGNGTDPLTGFIYLNR